MAIRDSKSENVRQNDWTFLTNHAHVLLAISQDPEIRMLDIAKSVGITERAAQRIVMELEEDGYLERERVGRRNKYKLDTSKPLRHPMDRLHRISALLNLLAGTEKAKAKPSKRK